MLNSELLGHFDVKSGTVLLFDFGVIEAFAEKGSARAAVIAALEAGKTEVPIVGYVTGTTIAGVTPGRYAVRGERFGDGELTGTLRSVTVDLSNRSDTAARTVALGTLPVDCARLGVFDVAAIDHWNHSEPTDGKADVVFWGLHGEEVAKRFDASVVDDMGGNKIYGFVDRPAANAAEIAERLHELRSTGELRFAFDFRPHTDAFAMLAQIRKGATESGTIEVGGHAVCGFMTSVGDGFFPATLEVDAEGRPLRCTITIVSEEE
jgi:hypothetical protein